jgi:hypothetical protein
MSSLRRDQHFVSMRHACQGMPNEELAESRMRRSRVRPGCVDHSDAALDGGSNRRDGAILLRRGRRLR